MPVIGEKHNDQCRDDSACKSKQGDQQGNRAIHGIGQTYENHQPKCCSCMKAKNPGIGKRVARNALKGRTRDTKSCSSQDCNENARQTVIEQHNLIIRAAMTKQRLQYSERRETDRTRIQANHDNCACNTEQRNADCNGSFSP
ncbi:hypothetical protein D3C76_1114790 [compost metagenome]